MKKNDDIIIEITALTSEGTGIGRIEGIAVFVEGTAVGDKIEAHIILVKKNYAIGKLLRIISPSPFRKEVDCQSFSRCGGCSFRHITYKSELAVKEKTVADAIKRIGGINLSPLPITASPKTEGYRNKAQYPVCSTQDGISYGFYARNSHRVIINEYCLLQPEIFGRAMKSIKKWADQERISTYNDTDHTGILRHVLLRYAEKTGQLMIVVVINRNSLPSSEKLIEILKDDLKEILYSLQYNVNTKDTNVILGKTTVLIYGKDYINDEICGVKVKISAESFYQVNRKAAEVLYQKAAAYIEKDDKVLIDLFCGIGTIGLSVLNICGKEGRQLYGVEIVPKAIENAKENAISGGFENCKFISADAASAAEKLNQVGIKPDVVIVDPPRKGCDQRLLETISNGFSPKKLIYISCDPATLARDSKILFENSYILKEYSPVDLFPGTAHVETVALFVKGKVKTGN